MQKSWINSLEFGAGEKRIQKRYAEGRVNFLLAQDC
jgi:hypothetical protein